MSLIMLIFVMAVMGFITWLITTYIPMPQPIKMVIIVVAVVACIVYTFHAMGVVVPNPSVPQLK